MNVIKIYIFIIVTALALNNMPLKGQVYILQGDAPYKNPPAVTDGEDVTFYWKWVKSGKVFMQKGYFPAGEDYSILVYKTKDGEYFYLSGCMDSMNVMLAKEVKKEEALQFLEKEMTAFIHDILRPPTAGSAIITKRYVETTGVDFGRKILEPYIIDKEEPYVPYVPNKKIVTVEGNKWTINLNVRTKYGAIEAWLISGTVDPLRITTFNKNILKPEGTLGTMRSTDYIR